MELQYQESYPIIVSKEIPRDHFSEGRESDQGGLETCLDKHHMRNQASLLDSGLREVKRDETPPPGGPTTCKEDRWVCASRTGEGGHRSE